MIKPHFPWIPGFHRPPFQFKRPTIRITTEMPENYILIALLILVFFLIGGGVYDLLERPPPMGIGQYQVPQPLYPELSRQFLLESLIATSFFAIGALGFVLLHWSMRYAYDTSYATSLMVLGFIMILIGFIGAQVMITAKLG